MLWRTEYKTKQLDKYCVWASSAEKYKPLNLLLAAIHKGRPMVRKNYVVFTPFPLSP